MSMSTSIRDLSQWLWHSSKGLRLQAVLNSLIGILSVTLDFAFIYATKWTIDIATNRAEGSLRIAAYTLAGIMLSKIVLGFARKWVSAWRPLAEYLAEAPLLASAPKRMERTRGPAQWRHTEQNRAGCARLNVLHHRDISRPA